MIYAEASYFPDPVTGKRHHFAHIALYEDVKRIEAREAKMQSAFKRERRRVGRPTLTLVYGGRREG